jgi:NADH dehydrogenase
VHPLSINPRIGGPKKLPIIELDLDDEEDPEMKHLKDKPRIVILGGGWGVRYGRFTINWHESSLTL